MVGVYIYIVGKKLLHILGCFSVQTVSYIVLLIFSVRLAIGKDARSSNNRGPTTSHGRFWFGRWWNLGCTVLVVNGRN